MVAAVAAHDPAGLSEKQLAHYELELTALPFSFSNFVDDVVMTS
jgi:hypothetical protein